MQLLGGDLNQLLVLEALLDTSSVKAAARRVGLSPSAVSHALARLREQLDDPLLVRAGQRLVPTPRAEQIRPRLAAALEALERAVAPGSAFDPTTGSRRFRVVCTDHVELGVMRPLGTRLSTIAPGIDLFSEAPRGTTVERLRQGGCDLAIGAFAKPPPDICSEDLFEERFVVLMREGHPAAEGRLTVERYADLLHLLVAPGGEPRGAIDDRLEALGLHRRIARMVSTFLVAPFLVAESDLVVTLPSRVTREIGHRLGLIERRPPPEVDVRFELRMLWHRRAENDMAHAWLRDELRRVVADWTPSPY